jgi:asparagine synthase (glutamine-hydrolysing)
LEEVNNNTKNETFSTVFNKNNTKYCDESIYIEKLTNDLNIHSHQIEPTPEAVKEEYLKMIYAMENPQESTLMSYMFTYKIVSAANVAVTIDGQGADELQAGYLYYLINYFANIPLKTSIKEFSSFRRIPNSSRFIYLGLMFNFINKIGLKHPVRVFLMLLGKFTDPFVTSDEIMLKEFKSNLVTLLHYGDRASMFYSIETRFPFLDYHLIEFWYNLPFIYKLHDGWTKYCARLAMNNKLPDLITWRKDKMGWEMPQREWFKAELKDWTCGIIEQSEFLKSLKIHPNTRKILSRKKLKNDELKQIIRYLNLALWYNTFSDYFI